MRFLVYGFMQMRSDKSFRVKKFRAKSLGQESFWAGRFGRMGENRDRLKIYRCPSRSSSSLVFWLRSTGNYGSTAPLIAANVFFHPSYPTPTSLRFQHFLTVLNDTESRIGFHLFTNRSFRFTLLIFKK